MFLLAAWISIVQMGVTPGENSFMKDTITTSSGALTITFIGHGTLMFEMGGRVIHVDPWSRLADYSKLPKADIILVTHDHPDHFDPKAIQILRTLQTTVIANTATAGQLTGAIAMKNGDTRVVDGVSIEAVPAYNVTHTRPDGVPFHPKGESNGYILTFGDTRVYVAGDTENIPEMKALMNVAIAFLPMNLPYTMTPEMVADAAKAFRPRILYPYHTGALMQAASNDTDVSRLPALLKDIQDIEVRIRPMK